MLLAAISCQPAASNGQLAVGSGER